MDHSYEEIRKMVLEVLAEKSQSTPPSQYRSLVDAVAIEITKREKPEECQPRHNQERLSYIDLERIREVFWDLFREGIITLGSNDANADYPWFKVTERGRRIIEHQEQYFFHDVKWSRFGCQGLVKTS